jgi:hypothetical protein
MPQQPGNEHSLFDAQFLRTVHTSQVANRKKVSFPFYNDLIRLDLASMSQHHLHLKFGLQYLSNNELFSLHHHH